MTDMRYITFFILFSCTCFAEQISPEAGYKRLMEGNKRFVEEKLMHPHRDEKRRVQTAPKQSPFGIVLSCSDSRVAPEILFDQGIGDLFIVRVAGNVVGPIELASIEYSALYLGSTVLFVLGHKNCGAVSAVLDGNTKDIEPIAELIQPAVEMAKTQKGSQLENAIKDNVLHVVKQLENVPLIADLMEKKKFAVIGGYYDVKSG
ncbi:MAG: carbonic anhydrase [Simkaniaceae bacterium]|nr:carbonic anhydrase [Candidatus Sacchlamyda saccharinae]